MIARLRRWWRRWSAFWSRKQRERMRAFDASHLWPAIYAKCDGDFVRYIDAAVAHTIVDPAWWDHEDEWIDHPVVSPWAWWRTNVEGKVRP